MIVRCFDHEGLHQFSQFSFVTDEDLHGQNVLQLSTTVLSLYSTYEHKYMFEDQHKVE